MSVYSDSPDADIREVALHALAIAPGDLTGATPTVRRLLDAGPPEIRIPAAYLLWLGYAAALNFAIWKMNA